MKSLSFLFNLPGWLKAVFGLVSVVVLGVVLSLFVNLRTAQTQTSPGTPTPSVFLPFIFQSNQVDQTTEWKTYIDPTYGYSFEYPPDWDLTVGNGGNPDLPEDAVHVGSIQERFRVTVAVEEITNENFFTSKIFQAVSGEQVVYFDTVQRNLVGRRAETTQPGPDNTKTKIVYTSFPFEKQIYYLYTIFPIDPTTEEPILTGAEELRLYNLIVSSFNHIR